MFSMCPDDLCSKEEDVKISNKTAILSGKKWRTIQKHLHPELEANIQNAEDKKFKNYLVEELQKLTKDWKISSNKHVKTERFQRMEEEKRKLEENEKRFKKITKKEEQRRRDQIARAEKLFKRTKMTSLELQSAAMLCKVLKVQQLQREMNEKIFQDEVERNVEEGRCIQRQAQIWIEDQQKKMIETKMRNKLYLEQVLEDVKAKEQSRKRNSSNEIEVDRKVNLKLAQDAKNDCEMKRKVFQKKQQELKENLLEAMEMAMERQKREKTVDEMETVIAEMYTQGKNRIDAIKAQKKKEAKERAVQLKEENARKLAKILDDEREKKEEEMRKFAVERYTSQLENFEKQRVDNARFKRDGRIRQQQQEFQHIEAKKNAELEDHHNSIANRLKNEDVNLQHYIQKTEEKIRLCKENQSILMKQMKEREDRERRQREYDIECQQHIIEESNKKDDETFFKYAENLISEATKKSRPLFPLESVVTSYKKRHELELRPVLPKHLASAVGLGVKQRHYEIK